MIDGIRLAPTVYAIRRAGRISGDAQSEHLECARCLERYDEASRAAARCGWLPAHRLPDPDPEPDPDLRHVNPFHPADAPKPVSQECPGWLIALPEVTDAMEAHLWWEKGQLGEFVGGRPASPHLRLYLGTVAGAIAELDLEREKERERERKRADRR